MRTPPKFVWNDDGSAARTADGFVAEIRRGAFSGKPYLSITPPPEYDGWPKKIVHGISDLSDAAAAAERLTEEEWGERRRG